jgi:hypothetical protein
MSMPSSTPFVDPETGLLDRYQIRREAESLVKLIGLFVVVALAPLLFALVVGGGTIGFLFTVVAQFVLAVGTGITLMYVIARAIALSNDESAHARVRRLPGDGRTSERDERTDDGEADDEDEALDEPDDAGDDSNDEADETEDSPGSSAEPDEDTDGSADSPESSAEPDEDTDESPGSADDQ